MAKIASQTNWLKHHWIMLDPNSQQINSIWDKAQIQALFICGCHSPPEKSKLLIKLLINALLIKEELFSTFLLGIKNSSVISYNLQI